MISPTPQTLVLWTYLITSSGTNFVDDEECAMIMPGPPPPGIALNGIEGAGAGGWCISYESIDEAFSRARDKVGLRFPPREYNVYSLGELGTALQETTRLLADRYRLSREDISIGLPQVETFKTHIRDFCPRILRDDPRRCAVPGRYRHFDGQCNNMKHPTWGAANIAFRRFLPPNYADGISEPRAGQSGFPLPNARAVSAHVHRDGGLHDHTVTFMFVVWGQFVDHDVTLTAESKDPASLKDPECCKNKLTHHNCMPVTLPPQDPFYRHYKQSCMNMARSLAGVRDNCRLGPRAQINAVTSYIDGSAIYGSNIRVADSLRLLRGGLMRTLPVFKQLGLKDLLPLKLDYPDDGCIRPEKDIYCFLAGDNRVNEQIVLAALHTMFVRYHNVIATELSKVNPHWNDEILYQESRHIVAALMQHITYTEFLPMLLGTETMKKYGLESYTEGYFNGYDPDVDASVTASFITAAFRFGHSLLPSIVERWSSSHKFIGSQRLKEVLKRPYNLYKPGWYDQYIVGMLNQVAQAMDDAVTEEVTRHLFEQPAQHFGMDLATMNVQRAREHGVPSYSMYREWCGLPRMDRWINMAHALSNVTVTRYNDVYDHPNDVDLWSAGVSEQPAPGSMVGPTFSCIIARTFKNLKTGDRFWYENSNWPNSFTPDQLEEIRKIKLSRLVCDTSDDADTVQVYAMVLPDAQNNRRVSCKSRVLPRLDLTKWREDPLTPQRPVPTHDEENSVEDSSASLESRRRSFVRFPDDGFFS